MDLNLGSYFLWMRMWYKCWNHRAVFAAIVSREMSKFELMWTICCEFEWKRQQVISAKIHVKYFIFHFNPSLSNKTNIVTVSKPLCGWSGNPPEFLALNSSNIKNGSRFCSWGNGMKKHVKKSQCIFTFFDQRNIVMPVQRARHMGVFKQLIMTSYSCLIIGCFFIRLCGLAHNLVARGDGLAAPF